MNKDNPVNNVEKKEEKVVIPTKTPPTTPTKTKNETTPSIFDFSPDLKPSLVSKPIPIPRMQQNCEITSSPEDVRPFAAYNGHSPTFVPRRFEERFDFIPTEDLPPPRIRQSYRESVSKSESSATPQSSDQSINEFVKDTRKPTQTKISHLIELAEGHLKSDDFQRAYQANGLASQMCTGDFSTFLTQIREQRQKIINSEVQKCINRIENPSKNDENKSEASILRQALGMSKRQRNRRFGQQTKTKIETLKKTKRIEIRHEEVINEKDLTKMHETLLKSHEETKKAIEKLDKEIEELKTQSEIYKSQLKNRITEEKTRNQMLMQLKKQKITLLKFQEWLPAILKVKEEYKKVERELIEKKEEYSALMKRQDELRNENFNRIKEDNTKLSAVMSEESKLKIHVDNGKKELNELKSTLKEKKDIVKNNKEMYMIYLNLVRQRTLLRLETLKKRAEKRKRIEQFNELPPEDEEIIKLEESLNELLKQIEQQEKKLKNGVEIANLQQIKQPPNYSFECAVPL